MLRALLLLITLVIVGRLLARMLRASGAPARGSRDKVVAHMVRCAHCATFVPAADAVTEGGHSYCSEDHRRLGPAAGS